MAMNARRPRYAPNLPSVQKAKEFADHYKTEDHAVGSIRGYWHLKRVELITSTARRRRSSSVAMRCYDFAAVLLLVPVVVAIALAPQKPQ